MADIRHHCNRSEVTSTDSNPHLLLTNRNGDFLNLGSPNTSNYNGLLFRRGEVYSKTLFDMAPSHPDAALSAIDLHGHSAIRRYGGAAQRLMLLDAGLLAECAGDFLVTLDCKRLYDESDQGRVYAIRAEGPPGARVVMVSYTKYTDGSLAVPSYTMHLAFATDMAVTLCPRWRQVYYSYDIRRGTSGTPWVHDAFQAAGEGHIAFAMGDDADDARRRALDLLARREPLMKEHAARHAGATPTLPSRQQIAWRALDALRTHTGIMAGLPWFFQEWSRDELIATGGLLATKEYDALVRILDKWYSVVKPDGTLPAMYPDKGLPSSDAPGWLGKRTRDLLLRLADENRMSTLPASTIERWRDATGRIIDGYRAQMRDGLVWSGKNTTWMDTSHDDDGRTGACIEIQALFLALFDAHAHLCTMTRTAVDPARAASARGLIDAVHRRLYSGGRLLDGLHEDGRPDTAVRPNAFIAWYVAPRLFSRGEWQGIFTTMLPDLWLPWGGLSSISVHDRNYHPRYTGEDVASYHRGDSWYFVNNMAAMALHAVDPEGFKDHVDAIADASLRDLLGQGYAGHASELSNAAAQEPAGCYAQAWSASTLLELLIALGRDD